MFCSGVLSSAVHFCYSMMYTESIQIIYHTADACLDSVKMTCTWAQATVHKTPCSPWRIRSISAWIRAGLANTF